jgi:peptide/nickel transport system permease protein
MTVFDLIGAETPLSGYLEDERRAGMEGIQGIQEKVILKPKKGSTTFTRVMKYMGVRLVTLAVTVVIGVFLTVMIANMGGAVDQIRRNEIQENVSQMANRTASIRQLPAEEKLAWIEEQVRAQSHAAGLDQPMMVRTLASMRDALTLNLGRALKMNSDSGSQRVSDIILERLPSTLLLFGSSQLILFFVQLWLGLSLSRRYGSILDKFFIALAPASTAPAWFYGIFLILIFASFLRILPFGGMVDAPPPQFPLDYFFSLLKHMALPMMALTLNSIFLSVYANRTFFLIYSMEDYVEMAKAKGLSSNMIEQRYILRPALPTIITNFALGLLFVITGAPIMETIFQWPGLGNTTIRAIGQFDTPVIVGTTVVFAYLLVITMFLLNFVYALVDPRVKVGGNGGRS